MKQILLALLGLVSWLSLVLAALDCDTTCGYSGSRVQICHFNGKEFQTLCIRPNSVLRRPAHASEQDYCGPCTHHNKAFESTEELRQAVQEYVDHNHYDVDLATTYGWPMNQWNVSLITDFSELFAKKKSFNEDLSSWDTSRALSMSMMFWHCENLEDGGIGAWDVSRVQSFERMFLGATKFNGALNSWHTSQATNMMGVFWKASSFDKPLDNWDMSQVWDASRMFAEAHSFDQDLSSWKTTQMRDVSYMFLQATSFTRTLDLFEWDLSNVNNMERMLFKVPTATARQRSLIDHWERQWTTSGRPIESINTNEIFSSSVTTGAQQAVVTSSPSFYMRGNRPRTIANNETKPQEPLATVAKCEASIPS